MVINLNELKKVINRNQIHLVTTGGLAINHLKTVTIAHQMSVLPLVMNKHTNV